MNYYITYDELCELYDSMVVVAKGTSWLHPINKIRNNVAANTLGALIEMAEMRMMAAVQDARTHVCDDNCGASNASNSELN